MIVGAGLFCYYVYLAVNTRKNLLTETANNTCIMINLSVKFDIHFCKVQVLILEI
jgi:hypothetical protein